MNKLKKDNAVNGTVGKYMCQNGSVHFDQGKDQYLLVMMGAAYVDGFVSDPVTKTTSCIIAIKPGIEVLQPCMVRVDTAILLNAKSLSEVLTERGIVVCNANHASKYMLVSAAEAAKVGLRELVKKPGWIANGRAFFTGSKLIASSEIDADTFWLECSDIGVMRSRGDLDTWKKKIGNLVVENPIMLFTVCLGMASPLLGHLGLSSSMFNLVGEKGCGKTTALQVAASVFGNAVDPAQGAHTQDPAYIARFHGTVNGYEPILGEYSPLPVLLDELTEANAPTLYQLCYMMASGVGKLRQLPNGKAALRERWQSNIITSAEVTISGTIAASGKQMHGGQADRAIDIPITDVGVLNCNGPFDSFDAATSHLKRACSEQYGTAGEAIIQYCCDDPETVSDLLAMAEDIENFLLPAGCGAGERRVVKRLAGAIIAGRLAVLAGVFEEDAIDKIDAAVKLVTDLWWGARAGALARICRLLEEHADEIEDGKPDPDIEAIAFRYDKYVVIPRHVLSREFGDDATRMLSELKGLNVLKQEQEGRHQTRFCNNRFQGYVLLRNRIWPDEERLAA